MLQLLHLTSLAPHAPRQNVVDCHICSNWAHAATARHTVWVGWYLMGWVWWGCGDERNAISLELGVRTQRATLTTPLLLLLLLVLLLLLPVPLLPPLPCAYLYTRCPDLGCGWRCLAERDTVKLGSSEVR